MISLTPVIYTIYFLIIPLLLLVGGGGGDFNLGFPHKIPGNVTEVQGSWLYYVRWLMLNSHIGAYTHTHTHTHTHICRQFHC